MVYMYMYVVESTGKLIREAHTRTCMYRALITCLSELVQQNLIMQV